MGRVVMSVELDANAGAYDGCKRGRTEGLTEVLDKDAAAGSWNRSSGFTSVVWPSSISMIQFSWLFGVLLRNTYLNQPLLLLGPASSCLRRMKQDAGFAKLWKWDGIGRMQEVIWVGRL